MAHKVLIIEDNPDIAALVQLHLRDIHCDSHIAADGGAGLQRVARDRYDLVILDLMLPVMDGIEVCKQIRAHDRFLPVIMLTSRSTEFDRVLGLEIGADDYITKPFSIPELVARVKAQLRRIQAFQSQPPPRRLQFGDLVIEPEKHCATLKGETARLTAKEFDLLLYFASHPGRVYNRAELLDRVWGYSYEGYEHTVNSHINRLRNKIERDPANPRYIVTVWGVGYKFNELHP